MAQVRQTITINAPVEKVFKYANDPANLTEVWPNLVEVKDVRWLPNGGNSFRAVYKMIGMRFEIVSKDIVNVANRRVVTKTEGGIESTTTFTFRPHDGGTELTVEAEYVMPVPLIGKLGEIVAAKINERDIVYFLNYLKLKMEKSKG